MSEAIRMTIAADAEKGYLDNVKISGRGSTSQVLQMLSICLANRIASLPAEQRNKQLKLCIEQIMQTSEVIGVQNDMPVMGTA